jgi:hypothetical protein
VKYDDEAPWPTTPDGNGTSLTRTSHTIYGNEPTNWTGEAGSPGEAEFAAPVTTITGTAGSDTYHVIRSGGQLHVYENTPPTGQPTYTIELATLGPSLTFNTQAGDDALIVEAGAEGLGPAVLIYQAGGGNNSLTLQSGTAQIDSTAAGGTLATTVKTGAQLSTTRLLQNSLVLETGSRLTLLPNGETSVVTSLDLDPGATLDLGNNALVLDYAGASPVATVREQILSGRGGVGLGAS